MTKILACVDASAYAPSVCDLAAWASRRLSLPVELLHVVQRVDAIAQRHDWSGAIGLGAKTDLLQELTGLEEAESRLQVERGRVLLTTMTERLKAQGASMTTPLHRHGGIVETIVEREADARVVVIGKRGASHEFAADHIGSKVERVVRASGKPVLIASRTVNEPTAVVLAYDGSMAAKRALERVAKSPLFSALPVHIVTAGPDDGKHRDMMESARAQISHDMVRLVIERGSPEDVIATAVESVPNPLLVMGAYGHSPLRSLIVGSTTTALIRTVHIPILLVR